MTIRDILGVKEPKAWKPKGSILKPIAAADCVNPTQVVGLEIETENCNFREFYEALISNLWIVKEDGSLRGRAWEFVSQPVEIGTLMAGELADFYRKTAFTEDNYTDRCSIHVHTNITNMTATQVATLFLVYSVMEDVLFEFVNFFNGPKEGHFRDTNIYCVPWNQCRLNHNMVQTMFADANYAFKNWQKYTALNILPARSLGTVEWRHMHGSADVEKINKWLNIIGAIMKYATDKEFDYVVKTIRELNDTSAYRQFYMDVLCGILPFDQKYEQAISSGVVNAKYALIGLKDNKPVTKATSKRVQTVGFADPVAVNALYDRIEDWNPPPVEAGQAAPQGAAAAQIRRLNLGDVALRDFLARDRRRRYEELRRLATAHRRLQWPLTAGVWQETRLVPATYAVRDIGGHIRDITGEVKVGGVFTESNRFVKGLGGDYWVNVEEHYRPNDKYLWPGDYEQEYLTGEEQAAEGDAA